MKIYIAGAYSKPDPVENTAIALRVAERVWLAGDVPFVPHLTLLYHFAHQHPYEDWLAYDMEWLRVCDGLLRIPGESSGADKEMTEMVRLGKPVWFGLNDYLTIRGILARKS